MAAEEVLEPGLSIVDPHHHLWDWPKAFIDAFAASEHPFVQIVQHTPRYLFDELMADLGDGHDVAATVYMECGAMYSADASAHLACTGEVEFVNGIAAMSASGAYGPVRACAAIVGHADLTMGAAVEEVLRALTAAAPTRFRGIRQSASYDADPAVLGPLGGRAPESLYLSAKFREGFAVLERLGLSFDAWLLEPQLGDLVDLARAFPGATIVLDHVGTPLGIGAYRGRLTERFDAWRSNIRVLAACPNVVVKLGGLAMPFAGFPWSYGNRPASSAELASAWKPYIDTCIEAFGPSRAMFESNFPVDGFTCSYRTLWNALKRCGSAYTADEKRELFSGTARRVYRIAA